MKAAVLFAQNEPLRIVDVELAPPGRHEVRVRMAATGICASDWHTMTGAIPSPFPSVLGHEGAGIVEAIGDDVTAVAPGDHVVLSWVPSCGHCYHCEAGRPNLCSVATTILYLINAVLVPVLFAIAFIVFLYGVAKAYIFSAGEPEKVSEGHKLILWGIIGFVVMISLWGLVNVVANTFGLWGYGAPKTPVSYPY